MHIISNFEVPRKASLSPYGTALAQLRSASKTHLSRDGRSSANLHTVSNMHQVIKDDVVADLSILECSTIDGTARTDLDTITHLDTAQLKNFLPTPARRCKAKPVRTYYGIGVNQTVVPNSNTVINRHIGSELSPRTNGCPLADPNVRPNPRVVANRGALANNSTSVNRYISAQLDRPRDNSTRMHSPRWGRSIIKQFSGTREVGVGLIAKQYSPRVITHPVSRTNDR